MQEAGYAVGHFGKWHVGITSDAPHPEAYGIDESMTYVSNAMSGRAYPENDEWFAANSTRWIVDDGIAFIEVAASNGQPFYLNLWIHISHAPLRPSPEQLEKFPLSLCPGPNPGHQQTQCAMQIYRASQYEADLQIGRLLDWLDDQNLRESTLFVFATDNGTEDPHVDMHAVGDPGPHRGLKRSLYEGGVRAPFIASWPGHIPQNVYSAADIMSADWLPTVAGMTGVELSSNVSKGATLPTSPSTWPSSAACRRQPAQAGPDGNPGSFSKFANCKKIHFSAQPLGVDNHPHGPTQTAHLWV